jgi:hypothetical protein
MSKVGAVYVAFGQKYVDEAAASATSLRTHNPNLPICLISDSREAVHNFDTHVYAERQSPAIRGKLEIFKSPFERSLFLDSDTLVFAPLDEVFELLEAFDMVFQQDSSGYHYKLDGVPHAFPEPSTAVLGFRKSVKMDRFAASWAKYFDAYTSIMGREWDQRSFRHAIYTSDLRHSVLPPEYNFMPYFPQYAMGDLKIMHGRPPELLHKTKRLMDKQLGPRVHVPRLGCIRHYHQMTIPSFGLLGTKALGGLCFESLKRAIKIVGLYPVAQKLSGRKPS